MQVNLFSKVHPSRWLKLQEWLGKKWPKCSYICNLHSGLLSLVKLSSRSEIFIVSEDIFFKTWKSCCTIQTKGVKNALFFSPEGPLAIHHEVVKKEQDKEHEPSFSKWLRRGTRQFIKGPSRHYAYLTVTNCSLSEKNVFIETCSVVSASFKIF